MKRHVELNARAIQGVTQNKAALRFVVIRFELRLLKY